MELRQEVLYAWRQLKRIQREAAQLAELPVAQLMALTANMNRDPKRTPKAFSLRDFTLFAEREDENEVLDAEVAAVALDLKHEDRCPPLLVSCWDKVVASVKQGVRAPALRALHNDDESVWLLAPKFEGRNIRAGLALVRGRLSGPVTVRDMDRPLAVYNVVLPERPGWGWIEASCLLMAP